MKPGKKYATLPITMKVLIRSILISIVTGDSPFSWNLETAEVCVVSSLREQKTINLLWVAFIWVISKYSNITESPEKRKLESKYLANIDAACCINSVSDSEKDDYQWLFHKSGVVRMYVSWTKLWEVVNNMDLEWWSFTTDQTRWLQLCVWYKQLLTSLVTNSQEMNKLYSRKDFP